MNWQDKGYLLSIFKHKENSSIAEFFTEEHGKSRGIIFGSTSKKIKNYLFIGNKFHINYNSKNESSIGNFKIEIDRVNTPLYLDQKLILYCIIYSITVVKLLSVENQANQKVYQSLEIFFNLLNNKFYFKDYIYWELELLKNFGYELNYADHTKIIKRNGISIYVSKSDENKIIPDFLIKNKILNISNSDLILAFDLTGDFMSKSILNDNNLSIPEIRYEILKILNNL